MDVVDYEILIGGRKINRSAQVMAIRTVQAVGKLPTAEIDFYLSPGLENMFALSESDNFLPGRTIEIQVGYDSKEETVFKGIILSQQLLSEPENGIILRLNCGSKAAKLAGSPVSNTFEDSRDSEIITHILSEAGLSHAVEATAFTHPRIIQDQQSQWEFLGQRATLNGLLLYVEGDEVRIKKPTPSGKPVVRASYDKNLLAIDTQFGVSDQYKSAQAIGVDAETSAFITKTAEEPNIKTPGNVSGQTLAQVLDKPTLTYQTDDPAETDNLQTIADAMLLRARLAAQQASLTVFGNSKAKLNRLIAIEGLGKRFDGEALITRVEHTLYEGRWKTMIGYGLAADFSHFAWPDPLPAAAANEDEEQDLSISTPNGLQLSLDDEQKIITLSTPANNQLVLSDESGSVTLQDQHGNKIILNADGISLETSSKLQLNSSGGDLTMTALNIDAKANHQLDLEGTQSAKLSAVGQTIVRGAMVMIN